MLAIEEEAAAVVMAAAMTDDGAGAFPSTTRPSSWYAAVVAVSLGFASKIGSPKYMISSSLNVVRSGYVIGLANDEEVMQAIPATATKKWFLKNILSEVQGDLGSFYICRTVEVEKRKKNLGTERRTAFLYSKLE